MKTLIKPVYYCSTCKKKGLSKWRIEQHEKFCLGNPDNVPACFKDCKYLEKYGNGFYCNARDSITLHTPRFEIMQSQYYHETGPSELMPKTCDKFEQKSTEDILNGLGI